MDDRTTATVTSTGTGTGTDTDTGTGTISDTNLFDFEKVEINTAFKHLHFTFTKCLKPLLLLSTLQFLTLLASMFAIGLVVAVETSGILSKVLNGIPGMYVPGSSNSSGGSAASDSSYGGYNRRLDDMSTGLLEFVDNFGVAFAITAIVFLNVLGFIMAFYSGAMIHAVSEFYSGEIPNTFKSIKYAWSMKFKILIYQLIFGVAIVVLFFVCVGIPELIAYVSSDDYGDVIDRGTKALVVGFLIFYIAYYSLLKVMFGAALPAIIVEKTSSTGAFTRSWNLLAQDFFMIFCIHFSYGVVLYLPKLILNAIAQFLPPKIGFVVSECAAIFLAALDIT